MTLQHIYINCNLRIPHFWYLWQT